jgi:uncharacterized membrane protein YGL010W
MITLSCVSSLFYTSLYFLVGLCSLSILAVIYYNMNQELKDAYFPARTAIYVHKTSSFFSAVLDCVD